MLFTFPSRYWCTIGHRRVFRVGGWSPQVPTGFHVSGSTQEHTPRAMDASRTGLLPCFAGLSRPFRCLHGFLLTLGYSDPRRCVLQPRQGEAAMPFGPCRFALDPLSLAATRGISVDFFSSGYLDVSVPRVVFPPVCVRGGMPEHELWRVCPFGNPRIKGCVRLPAEYRCLPRPSSASCAKASTVCPWYLAFLHVLVCNIPWGRTSSKTYGRTHQMRSLKNLSK